MRDRIPSAVLLLLCCTGTALAADHVVSPSTGRFDCSGVSPGDTVTLAAGSRGPLVIEGCTGTASRPIMFRNDPTGKGPAIIERVSGNSGGFVLTCTNCVWTRIDGSGKWDGAPSTGAYGIKVTIAGGGSPTAFVRVSGLSRFVTIRGIEVDGKWPSLSTNGIGISVNDHSIDAAANPGVWTEGIVIEESYVHDVEGEGMYVGPNWGKGGLPLRNIAIRRNLVEDTGWDGINLKSTIGGGSEIHHNVVRRAGKAIDSDAGQHAGIALLDGSAKIYNNWVDASGESGITHRTHNLPSSYGVQIAEIYNNVVINSGLTGPLAGNGISSGGRDGTAPVEPRIYNNTVVKTESGGIRVGSGSAVGFVRDNIVADAGATAISAPAGVRVTNNLIGTTEKIGFVDAPGANFRLKSSSPALNNGLSQFPPIDHDDIPRPQHGAPDQGAYEFVGDEPAPTAPTMLAIE